MSLEWILLGLRLLATVILYTFLGLAFYIIWRDLKQAKPQTAPDGQLYCLRVIVPAGDNGLAAGQALPLQPVTLLGRDPENTIVINDASISGRHARLNRENGVWWLEDLGSKNGTLLNDLQLSKPASVTNGDTITIGDIRFQLEFSD